LRNAEVEHRRLRCGRAVDAIDIRHAILPGAAVTEPVRSPCIKVCVMDPATGLCTGCRRTLDEIACWASLSDAEREAIMKDLPARGGHQRTE